MQNQTRPTTVAEILANADTDTRRGEDADWYDASQARFARMVADRQAAQPTQIGDPT